MNNLKGAWFSVLVNGAPKDFFPLPRIDILVDSIAGFRFMCFLDAYRGYHQIFLRKEDEEKTAFVTDKGTVMLQCLSA